MADASPNAPLTEVLTAIAGMTLLGAAVYLDFHGGLLLLAMAAILCGSALLLVRQRRTFAPVVGLLACAALLLAPAWRPDTDPDMSLRLLAMLGVAAMTLARLGTFGSLFARARQSQLLALTSTPSVLIDVDGCIHSASASFAALLNTTPNALTGKPLDQLWSLDAPTESLLRRTLYNPDGGFCEIHTRAAETSHDLLICVNQRNREPLVLVQAFVVEGKSRSIRELRSSETKLRQISDHALGASIVVDLAGNITYANAEWCRLLELDADLLIGQQINELLHPNDVERVTNITRQAALAPDQAFPLGRLRLLRKQGEPVHLDAKLAALHDDSGVIGSVLSGRDISDRIQVERTLRNAESKFAAIFHASPQPFLVVRFEDRVLIDFNDGFARLTGLSREEAMGERIDQLPCWTEPLATTHHLDNMRVTGERVDDPLTLSNVKDRISHEVLITSRFVEVNGQMAALMMFHDVTYRAEAQQALRDTEEKFEQVFNSAPEGMLIHRLDDSVIIDANRAFCDASGFSREEMIGTTADALGGFSDAKQRDRLNDLLRGFGGFRNLEVNLVNKSRELVPTLVSATTLDIGGEACVLATFSDLSELRSAQIALRQSEERFRSAFHNAPMGIALVASNLHVIDANHWFADMLGHDQPPTERRIIDIVPDDERVALERELRRLVDGEVESVQREQRVLRSNGEIRFATLHALAQRETGGKPLYMIVQLVDITDIRRSQEQMERLAFYDALTDLANRRLFMDRLEQAVQRAQRSGRPAALLYLDLDQFKRVNDTLGHEVGDELLKIVANRLRQCVRREDTVARPGGDEFNILLHEVRDAEAAAHVAEHVLRVLREPATIAGYKVTTSTSIGIALIPEDGTDPTTLVQRADQAMYRAKQHGRDTYRFFGDARNARTIARLNFEHALERALQRDELTLFLQPIYRLDNAELYAVETLLRWQHPERGLLEPDAFLRMSETAGYSRAIDAWVLRNTCRQMQLLQDTGSHVPAVAINLSARQLRDRETIHTIMQTLSEFKLEPTCLQIEVSEQLLLADLEQSTETLRAMHDQSLSVTVDDFGLAASSLTVLTRLPISRVKLDTTVVARLSVHREARVLLETVANVCKAMKRDLIGKGIESAAQAEALRQGGCNIGQGFWLGAPQSVSELIRTLQLGVPRALSASTDRQDTATPSR